MGYAHYFNHFRRKYHNSQFSILNSPFARLCVKSEFISLNNIVRSLSKNFLKNFF